MGIAVTNGPVGYGALDKTLVAGDEDPEGMDLYMNGVSRRVRVYEKVIDHIKAHKSRGHKVIFWSNGGADWAQMIAKTLNISNYIDAYLSKPTWFIDDLPAAKFMPENIRRDLREKK